MAYKIIDGVIYKTVDGAETKAKVNALATQIAPYQQGIKDLNATIAKCKEQIVGYDKTINNIIAASGLDTELLSVIAPELVACLTPSQ